MSEQMSSCLERSLAEVPVALIGLGALFPGAGELRSYWSNIVDAVDCIEDVPSTHWRIDDHYDPDPSVPDKSYAKRGGFIPAIEFDPMEFGMPPNILGVTDVLQLLSLVVAKQTLVDAGVTNAGWYDPSRTGVVLGITGANALSQPLAARLQTPVLKEVVRSCGLTGEDAEQIAAKFKAAFAPWEENSFPGMLGNVVAGRIANRFDFGGMNCTVDAACASSLAAVRMAVSELVSGRSDLMISGGCDAENTILMYLCFSKTPAFSKMGRVRPFDEAADGTLIGEGIGMLALKRLADAERDGDRIYAVLHGLGSSSDGRFKSIYAPRGEGQELALGRAYADAGVGPETVGLMECHGTGTAVGDLVELSALRDVFAAATDEKQFCAVGSVKSQIGHTKGAAGAASMIKVALALHQKVLPPTINVEKPREAAGFSDSPFYVNTAARPWLRDSTRSRRRAALSSFGFGGTNFHCVLEEHHCEVAEAATLHRTCTVHLWYAPDVPTLLEMIDSHPRGVDDTVAVPAACARLVLVAKGDRELAEQRDLARTHLKASPDVEAFELPGVYYRNRARDGGRVGALFAGQGSQYVGMGAATAIGTPSVRAEFDEMSLAFGGGGALSQAVFPPPAFDRETTVEQEETLKRTELAQPAIGSLSAGQFRFLRDLGLRIDGALGHSFGELTALWATGALDDDGFRTLTVARGRAMATLPDGQSDRGGMAAVRATPEELAPLLADTDVVVCNLNAPDQTVVGGGSAAVRTFVEAAKRASIGAKPLPVSAAFHTRYVAHASDAFRMAVSAVNVGQPECTVYANTAGAEYTGDTAHNQAVLIDQLSQPVSFAPRVRQMYDEGYRTFLEFGPRSVLSGLVRKILGPDADVTVLAADSGSGTDGDRTLKQFVARLIALGLPLNAPNRHVARAEPEAEKKGLRIPLNGVNYVPEERRRAYQDMLVNGYRVTAPTARNGDSQANGSRNVEVATVHGATTGNGSSPTAMVTVGAVAGEHLSLHREYLDNQLRVAERLSTVLANHCEHGEPADNVVSGIAAVTEHSVAIGQSHRHASEVLRAFAFLDAGAPMPVDQHPAATEYQNGSALSPPGNGHHQSLREVGAVSQPAVPAAPSRHSNTSVMDTVGQAGAEAAEALIAEAVPEDVPEPETSRAGEPAGTDAMSVESVTRALLQIVADKTGYPADMVDPTMDVEADLGIDSIKRVEILGALHERFPGGAMPSPEQLGELRTLLDIVNLVTGAEGAVSGPLGEVVADPKADGAPGIARRRARLFQLPPVAELVGCYVERPVALVAGGQTALAQRCVQALHRDGWTVHTGPDLPHGVARLDLVLAFAGQDATDSWSDASTTMAGTLALAGRTQRLLEAPGKGHRRAFVTVTRIDGALGAHGTDEVRGLLGGLPGLTKTLAIEAPTLFCRAVDLAPDLADDDAAMLLLAELRDSETGWTQIGIDADGVRSTMGVDGAGTALGDLAESDEVCEPGPDDLFVVTGGGRGVTAACAIGLARRFGTGLLLLGRTPWAASEPDWAAGVPLERLRAAIADQLKATGNKPTPRDVERVYRDLAAQREVRETVTAIRATGTFAEYVPVDITDPDATAQALADYRARITGLIHGAGVLADQLIVDKRPDDVHRVLDAKLTGLRGVLDVVDGTRLRHVLLFSSVAGFFGNRGQADYAMANEALNRIAIVLRRQLPGTQVCSVNWGAWAGGMVTPELQRMFAQRGVPLIPVDRGVDMFVEQFTVRRSSDLVCVIGPDAPLASRDPGTPPKEPVVLRRGLGSLAAEPVLADHAIGGVPVLPATAALGAILRAAGSVLPDQPVTAARFSVLKGLVLDSTAPEFLDFRVTVDRESAMVTVLDTQNRPRYRAEVAATVPSGRAIPGLPPSDSGHPADVYRDGCLFHGPSLRGIRRVLADDAEWLVLLCQLSATSLDRGAYGIEQYDPLLADLLLQAALVRANRLTASTSLPAAIGEVEVHGAIPDGGPFVVVVGDTQVSPHSVRCDVTACAPDGTLLLRFGDVEVVTSPALGPKFAVHG